jgi:hypothetical protein
MKRNCQKYHKAFDLCVDALEFTATKLDPYFSGGLDYRKINILIFCVAGPIIFASSVGLNVVLALKLARLVR